MSVIGGATRSVDISALLPILYFGFAAGYLFWYKPAKDAETSRYIKALQITKRFGDCRLSLIRFSDNRENMPTHVWALVEFDGRYSSISSLCTHENYYEVDHTYMTSQKSIMKEYEEVMKLIRLLPYDIEIVDANITFDKYEQAIAKRKGYL